MCAFVISKLGTEVFEMSNGLKLRMVVAAALVGGCVCLTGLVATGNSAHRSPAAGKSVSADSGVAKRAAKASDNDLAGRRYRRYWRRHTV
jgi:hypothetical protein